jgi:acyl carrier protein
MKNKMDKAKKIFCETLGVSESEVSDDTAYNSFEPWDSLKHLRIVVNLEEEFGIDIDMDDVIDMSTFKKVREIVEKYIA